MSLDKKFQEKLRNHRIVPTAKPWERIEAELNQQKKRSTFVIYSRWTAAASVALMITAYANWNRIPIGSSVVDTHSKSIVPTTNNDSINTTLRKSITDTAIEIKKPDNQLVIPSNIKKINAQQTIEKKEFLTENKNIVKDNDEKLNEKSILPRRSVEQSLAFLSLKNSGLNYNRSEPQLNLPPMPIAMQEEIRLHKKWQSFINEEMKEESDSTFTERTFVMVDQKTRTFVQRNWKPVLREFFRLRKGY